MNEESHGSAVLVLDDEPFVLKLLVHQLRNLGYEDVTGCERAAAALAVLDTDIARVGTVICDLDMPEMDGVEFIRHLAASGFAGALVLVSGEDGRVLQSVERLARAHKLNVAGALQKPVTARALAAVLNHPTARDNTSPKRKQYGDRSLLQALDEREIINHYQPQISVSTRRLVAVEALVRWQHPSDGLVYPDQFVAMAEKSGLIDRLTERVLVEGLAQLRAWERDGLTIDLSVNVSMDNLAVLAFPDFVGREAEMAGVSTSRLVLEVTETQLMKDPVAALEILTRLRLKRVRLSIDDFGTGHSSLAQLRDIPFNELKIDRGFTHGASDNPSLRAIFNASLGVAEQLGIRTVAEGVEDAADWRFLRSTGCDLAQGYFIGKPMPADALATWSGTWNARRDDLGADI